MAKGKAEEVKAPESLEECMALLATEQNKNAELTASLAEAKNSANAAEVEVAALKTQIETARVDFAELKAQHEKDMAEALAINTELQERLADSLKSSPVKGPVVKVGDSNYEITAKAVNVSGKIITAGDLAADEKLLAELVRIKSKTLKLVN